MPIVSVVVPTHNRARYAKACVEAVLAIADPDIQLVMTDTSTDRGLFDFLHGERPDLLADERFVYRKIDEPSDVTKNHNDAFALATGEYVGVIGDDDFITAALPEALRWASANDIPCISQTLPAVYAWPDFRSKLSRAGHAGRLYVPRRKGGIRWRDAGADLQACLHRAFQGTDHLPRTYHGFVKRELLEKAKALTGGYVHGSSPDMSGSVAVASQIERYCELDLPLSVPGISGGSNSGRSALNTHKGDLSSDAQTRKFAQAGWPEGLPRFFSVETVWAHAGLATLRHFRPELLPQFNYARLIAVCTLRHPDFPEAISVATDEARKIVGPQLDGAIRKEMRRERLHRGWYLVRRALNPTAANGRKYYKHLPDVTQASACYESYARKSGFDFACLDPGVSDLAEVRSPQTAILGGTGFVGRCLAERWPPNLPQPRFLIHRSRPEWLQSSGHGLRSVDLLDGSTVVDALEGCDVLIDLPPTGRDIMAAPSYATSASADRPEFGRASAPHQQHRCLWLRPGAVAR